MNQEKIRDLMIVNNFITINDCLPAPLIAVFRNTVFQKRQVSYLEDNGTNICDTIFLIDDKDIFELMGRSYPHDKYQKRMVQGTAKANYIASSYTEKALRKGYHRGIRALVQNVKFVIWRSRDMDLLDDDDYNETAIVADNVHGWAPLSAGCITTRGNMTPPTDDWKIADDWIYNKCLETFFNTVIFEHEDLSMDRRLRVGSRGDNVYQIQDRLTGFGFDIKPDGDYGPWTHEIIRQFQRLNGLADDGICGPVTGRVLWE